MTIEGRSWIQPLYRSSEWTCAFMKKFILIIHYFSGLSSACHEIVLELLPIEMLPDKYQTVR